MKKRTFLVVAGTALLLAACNTEKNQDVNEGIQVKMMTVTPSNAADGIAYAGTIEEESGTNLSFASAGTIKSLTINDGQSVGAGQVLGMLDTTTVNNMVTMAAATTQQARETLHMAEDAYDRMKQLYDKGSLSEMQWVEMQTKLSQAQQMLRQAQASETIARKGKSDASLKAPFAGYITRKTGDVGQNVLPGQAVARLVKIDQVKVVLSLPEDEVGKVEAGQTVCFTVSSLGGETFTGIVKEKEMAADPVSRCYKVKAWVNNDGHRLLPGMVCDASIVGKQTTMAIAIPANIVQIDIDNQPFVWTVKEGTSHKTHITLGENVGSQVIVASGLAAGDQVITEGQQKVYTGATVKE